MLKLLALVLLFLLPAGILCALPTHSQIKKGIEQSDTLKVRSLNGQCWLFRDRDPWKAVRFGLQSLQLAQHIKFAKGEAQVLNYLGVSYFKMEDYNMASEYFFKSLEFSNEHGIMVEKAYALNNISNLLMTLGDCKQALEYSKKALALQRGQKNLKGTAYAYVRMGEAYNCLQEYDSLLLTAKLADEIRRKLNDKEAVLVTQRQISLAYEGKKQYSKALDKMEVVSDLAINRVNFYCDLTRIYLKMKEYDKTIFFGNKVVQIKGLADLHVLDYLTEAYSKKNDLAKALYFSRAANSVRDSIKKTESFKHTKNLQILYESKEKEKENSKLRIQLRTNILLFQSATVFAVMLSAVAFFFFRMRRREKKINELLNVKNNEISYQRDMLEELNNTKNKFFSIIAHDLRGPISNLSSFMSHILSEKDKINKDLLYEYLHLVRDSTETIYKLLDGLLTWARSQRGEIKYKPENFNLSIIASQNIELFEATAAGKNLYLHNHIPENFIIFADKEMINTIIRNLMNNSIKYSNTGGCIDIDVRATGTEVEVSVKDEGVGMDENYLLHLFSLDSKRRSNDGTKGEKGSGLGLILCKEFIDKHQGRIWAESEKGKGSVFRFTVPNAATKT